MTTTPNLWIPDDFANYFAKFVVHPFQFPFHYNRCPYTPIPWRQAVFGRAGIDKAGAVRELATRAEIPITVIDIKFGHVLEGLNAIVATKIAIQEELFANLANTLEGTDEWLQVSTTPRHLLVINHGDILCYEPESEGNLLTALQMDMLETACVMVILLSDRVVNDPTAEEKLSPWARDCRGKFFRQFGGAMGYIRAPHSEYRIQYFKSIIEEFSRHMRTIRPSFSVSLSEGDYIKLGDYSTYSVPENIREWLQDIFVVIVHTPDIMVMDFEILFARLKHTTGIPHICGYDTRAVEDVFSLACQMGPIAPPKAPGGEKTNKIHLKTTDFTPDVAGLSDAAKVLDEIKPATPKRKKRPRVKH